MKGTMFMVSAFEMGCSRKNGTKKFFVEPMIWILNNADCPVICEDWHFTHMENTWSLYITKRGC